MSVESMTAALKVQGLTASEKIILIGIANHDGDGGAWPAIATLARYACVSSRQAQRAVAKLSTLGLIIIETNAGGTVKTRGDRRPNLYRLTIDGATSASSREEDGVTPETARGDIQRADGVTSTSPETSFKQPETSDDVFEKFWTKYPRKVGKPVARRAWNAAVKRDGVDKIREGFKAWVAFWTREGTAERWIPHPSTWLNQERYNDTPAEDRTLYITSPTGEQLSLAAFGKAGL